MTTIGQAGRQAYMLSTKRRNGYRKSKPRSISAQTASDAAGTIPPRRNVSSPSVPFCDIFNVAVGSAIRIPVRRACQASWNRYGAHSIVHIKRTEVVTAVYFPERNNAVAQVGLAANIGLVSLFAATLFKCKSLNVGFHCGDFFWCRNEAAAGIVDVNAIEDAGCDFVTGVVDVDVVEDAGLGHGDSSYDSQKSELHGYDFVVLS